MAEDFVELDELGSSFLEPVCEALMQVCPDGFRETVIGCVADQQVAEEVCLVIRELRRVGADELLAHERDEPRRLRLAVRQGLDGALVEEPALD